MSIFDIYPKMEGDSEDSNMEVRGEFFAMLARHRNDGSRLVLCVLATGLASIPPTGYST